MPKLRDIIRKPQQQTREDPELRAATDEILVYELRTNRKTF